MAITSTYPIIVPKLTDLIVGTQTYTSADPVLNNPTRNFTVQSIADLVSSPGTANTIAMFSTSGLTDSLITQAGSIIDIAGDIKASGNVAANKVNLLDSNLVPTISATLNVSNNSQAAVFWSQQSECLSLRGGANSNPIQTWRNTSDVILSRIDSVGRLGIQTGTAGLGGYGLTVASGGMNISGNSLISGGNLYFGDNTTTDPNIFNYQDSLHLYAAAGNQIDLGGGIGNRQNNVSVGNGSLYVSSGLTALGNTILGDDDSTTVTIESILNLQGPIKDSAGNLGSNGQVLVSTASSSVFWGATSGTGTVTSVDLSTNISAFTVAANPITSAGTITLNLNGGTAGQFLRQDGNWATPAGGGGAVDSVNGATGVVSLDTGDIAENTNLYYTEARVSANTDVAANTAKVGITTVQATDITNSVKNDTDTYTSTPPVTKIITLTQAEYNAIVSGGTPNVNTLYIII